MFLLEVDDFFILSFSYLGITFIQNSIKATDTALKKYIAIIL